MGKINIITKTAKLIFRHAPTILVGVGSISVVGGVVAACKETLHAEEVLDQCRNDILEVDSSNKKEVIKTYGTNALRIGKHYAPSIIMVGGGLFTIIFGHKILNKRYITMIGAYTVLNQDYRKYRKNIKDEYGFEADICAAHDLKVGDHIATDEDKEPIFTPINSSLFIPDRDLSNAAVFWGAEYSILASKNPEENLLTLRGQEEYANALFEEQGYLYLNDVYAMLGIEKLDEFGRGWVKGLGDDYVDFGIFDVRNGRSVNGDEQVFLLDFNHDGCILPYL